MKIKFLALAMIAMLFTACKPDPQGGEGTDPNKGEVESSYIAISLASTGMDRADDAKFDDGLDEERDVHSIYVFFFRNGLPFVGASGDNYPNNNYQSIVVNSGNQDHANDNISDINQSVLVIDSYKGELPNQMVAVLNWTPTKTTYTLAELQGELVGYTKEFNSTDYFIMSNSTYKNAAGDVYATPLEITDFKNERQAAIDHPVKVYVERVAAKVRVKTTGDIDDDQPSTADAHIFKLQQEKNNNSNSNFITLGGRTIYAKILGWDIYNDYTQSFLLKKLPTDLAHNDELDGFYWNSASNHRSYWAVNAAQDAGYNDKFNWETMTYPKQMYCCENTSGNTESTAAARTKVVLKAQLQDENGNPVEVARWFGSDYDGKQNLLTAVKNTLVNTYYYGVGVADADGNHSEFESIQWNDLMTVAGDGTTAAVYQVYFKLSTETGLGDDKTWYVRSGDTFTQTNATAINALLDDIDPALLYSGGHTYYQTDIKHLGENTFGVVRNHVYDIDIKSITGYGTPVVDLNYIIDTPEIPVDDEQTFVAAEINILSWRVVENNVNL